MTASDRHYRYNLATSFFLTHTLPPVNLILATLNQTFVTVIIVSFAYLPHTAFADTFMSHLENKGKFWPPKSLKM